MEYSADTIYFGGVIYTVNPEQPWVQAVAVRDGQFLAVGDDATVLQHAGASTKLVDLHGQMAMPGIHDAHTHFMEASQRQVGYECSLDDPQTLDELAEQLKAYWAQNSQRGWLVAGHYDSLRLGDDLVTRDFLDNHFPETPVILYDHTGGHMCTCNSIALELANLDSNTPDPAGGFLTRDAAGELTGKLYEGATALVNRMIPRFTDTEVDHALRFATDTCARFGITSVQEALSKTRVLDGLKRLEAAGELKTHVFAHIAYSLPTFDGWDLEQYEHLYENREAYRTHLIQPDGIKVVLDGTSLPPTETHVPFNIETGETPTDNLMIPEDRLFELMSAWTSDGMKIKTHCSGMGAIRIALDVYERLSKKFPDAVLSHEVAHNRWVPPGDHDRFAEIGVVAEMSPAIWHWPVFADSLVGAFEFRKLIDRGALVTIGTDWMLPETPDLFPALGALLTRGDESVALDEAIRMLTINGAQAVGKQGERGSIEAGKNATFIVLDRNLFESTPEEIQDTTIRLTVVDGRVVYEASSPQRA